MTETALVFDAVFDGQPLRQFLTLQDAMFWAEDLETPLAQSCSTVKQSFVTTAATSRSLSS